MEELKFKMDKKRITKNTLFLFIRTFFTMVVSLYISRVVISTLGDADIGVYNTVGGIVSMVTILTGTLTTAISRFITYELVSSNIERLRQIFSTSINVLTAVSIFVFIVIELVGYWYVNNVLVIPLDRMYAANWVLQCTIFAFVMGLVMVPFGALIVAHEKMKVYGYFSIIDIIFRLGVALGISILPYDKLVVYVVLGLAVTFILNIINIIYCTNTFKECSYIRCFDKKLIKEMTSFAGWHLIGNGAYVLNTQGVNQLMNVNFGVLVNGAHGIAGQVNSAVSQFVNNFTTAINPQITKTYAANNLNDMHALVCKGAKYSYLLMFFISLPLLMEMDYVLNLWLSRKGYIVENYTILFAQLTIASSLCTILSNTLVTAMFATGKIKKYQIVVGTFGSLVFPLTYFAFKYGLPPYYAYIIYFLVYAILLFIRLFLLRDMIQLSVKKYIHDVLYKILPITIISIILTYLFRGLFTESFLRLFMVCVFSSLLLLFLIYFIGIDQKERDFFKNKLKEILNKYGIKRVYQKRD